MLEAHLATATELLKRRLRCGAVDLFNDEYESQRENIRGLLLRSVEVAESNTVLIIGPRGCGKTTFINAILIDLLTLPSFIDNSIIVSLNSLIHVNDRIALDSITAQLNLEKEVEGKKFGTFAQNLAFLLNCLRESSGKRSKSIVFILDEFDQFCQHHNQTLLYNLFDVAQSAQAPICVVGITARLDVIELMEKRVKSRFSHRQVFLHQKADGGLERLQKMLTLPHTSKAAVTISEAVCQNPALPFLRTQFDGAKYKLPKQFVNEWNAALDKALEHKKLRKTITFLLDLNKSISYLKSLAFELLTLINPDNPQFNAVSMIDLLEEQLNHGKVNIISSLSVLEVCLLIAMMHHTEVYDSDPFNFEMICARFLKFANGSSSMQGLEREVVRKAFEHIKHIEFIAPAGGATRQSPEYVLHNLLLTKSQLKKAVGMYQNLPVEVSQWAMSSVA